MNTAYVTSKGQLVVPSRIRRRFGIKPGTRVNFVEEGDRIIFQPVTREYISSLLRHLQAQARREIRRAGASGGTPRRKGKGRPRMKTAVLDASALLAMFFGRAGRGKNARTVPQGLRSRPAGLHFSA